ncbi:MAG TPA: limonene-1,2-epoxide hydrolase family protein [Pseudonocardiaceae bacterium]|jgi:limonene-1,2-epoxide hydrolase|nr:limonene-1,2-epoxide hydrolase family protein [Pseudonocardiaceae bacterium]
MTRTPDELVTEFCAQWATPDAEKLASYFAENAIYHNIPMEPIRGRDAIRQFMVGFTEAYDGIDFLVHNQISNGGLVMNERTDVLRRKDGKAARLPVTGVFDIVDDRIAGWRDYFDRATFTEAMR